MWSYYGRKAKIAKKYPAPDFGIIIEPFAGTASYSLLYWEHEVILIDSYSIIIRIWKYLQQALAADILCLPEPDVGQSVDEFKYLCPEEKWLIGFSINNGSASPKKTPTGFGNFNSWSRDKRRIAKDLYKIRHWDIRLGDYSSAPPLHATWFIDPPYQHGSQYYHHGKIDYQVLAAWSKARPGQIIVCENSKADWMQFDPLTSISGQRHTTSEVMWTNY